MSDGYPRRAQVSKRRARNKIDKRPKRAPEGIVNGVTSKIWKKGSEAHGVAPAIILLNPKYARNVGVAVRNANNLGIKQVWFTGDRVEHDLAGRKRLPREERMKGWKGVEIYQYDRPLEQFPSHVVPVSVELNSGSVSLFEFEHPENAVYVFGPEDGAVTKPIRGLCKHFVVIPSHDCFNLAVATGIVLYDRRAKQAIKEGRPFVYPSDGVRSPGLVDTDLTSII